ncbi:ferric-chelate reductase 1-like [Sycon ciliatum]|uniref:ferric-chelate reductase 1-like n=1 Tax=Sycon ciliatum TaxID=27933 RepID=UPI0031F6B82B
MSVLFQLGVIVAMLGGYPLVSAFSQGGNAVGSHCKDLAPSHTGTMRQSGEAPYIISHDIPAGGYTPGSDYTVTVMVTNSSIPIHGYIVQFRTDNNLTIGGVFTSWNSSLSAQLDCDSLQDSITHYNPRRLDLPESISFVWQAPMPGTGPVRIWSSMVSSFVTYWVNGFVSDEIAEGTAVARTTVQPPTPVTISLTGCGSTKGCYRYPSACATQTECQYIYTQRVNNDYIEVELSTNVAGWVAIGYSVDRIMGGVDNGTVYNPDDVLACQYNGDRVVVKNGYIIVFNSLRWHGLDNVTDVSVELTSLGASYSNGILACRFRRSLYTASDRDKDLRKPFHQFYVWDPTPGGALAPLPFHATYRPRISSSMQFANSTAEPTTLAPNTMSGSTTVAVSLSAALISVLFAISCVC